MGTHKETGEIYVGYREQNAAKNVLSHIDLFEYRTSSKDVNPIFDQFNWCIVAEFYDGDDAYDFEQQLIFENWQNPLLLNRVCYYGKVRFKARKRQNVGKPSWNKGKLDWMTEEHKRFLAIQKKTEVDGILYPSATVAAKELGLKKTTLIKRVLSPNYPTYKYLEITQCHTL